MADQLWKKLQTIHRVVGGLIQVGRNEVGQQTLISERESWGVAATTFPLPLIISLPYFFLSLQSEGFQCIRGAFVGVTDQRHGPQPSIGKDYVKVTQIKDDSQTWQHIFVCGQGSIKLWQISRLHCTTYNQFYRFLILNSTHLLHTHNISIMGPYLRSNPWFSVCPSLELLGTPREMINYWFSSCFHERISENIVTHDPSCGWRGTISSSAD